MCINSDTGKVDEVEFSFMNFGTYATIPISVYRKIETDLKEKGKKREQKGGDDVSEEKHIKYYMTEHGQIFKFDRTKFISCELDLQNMVWFQNQDFTGIYFGEYIKYTELEGFEDCYEERKSI